MKRYWVAFGPAVLAVSLIYVPVVAARQSTSPTPVPELEAILERAADYGARFFTDVSAAAAEEEYVQTAFTDGVPGVAVQGNTRRRVMHSDYLLLRLPDTGQMMTLRDVFEVDGKPVRDHQDRLPRLFVEKGVAGVADALRLNEESSRYNIGPIDRTVNMPTLALQFLDRRYLARFKFKKGKQETVGGVRVWRIDYSEKARPTLIRRRGGEDVPAEGAFWIDPATGCVVRTRMRVELPRDPVTMQGPEVVGLAREDTPGREALDAEIVVSYRANEAVGAWVPVEVKEIYLYGPRRVNTTATFSGFRRLSATETVKPPK